MLLRSALVFLNGVQTSRGSVLCHVSKRNLLFPKCQKIYFQSIQRSASRFSRRSPKVPSGITSQLKIPFLFTVAVGSASIVGNQYLGKLISQRSHHPRSLLHWWNSKPDWFKVYWLICGSCIVVFASYRLAMLVSNQSPALLEFMHKYFVLKVQSGGAAAMSLPLLLSAFCHISPLHLGANMYILYNVAQTVVPEIGKDQFLGCYLFSTVVSGFTSLSYQLIKGRLGGSVGASGAILGLIGMTIMRHPEYKFYIIFLPFFYIPAPVAFGSLATIDLLGVIRGWSFFDHAGHLGGLLSGTYWAGLLHLKTTSWKDTVFKGGSW